MANLEFVILLDIRQSAPLLLSQAVVRRCTFVVISRGCPATHHSLGLLADCFMTFLLWLIETHIQELEEELKLLKNHSQPNIVKAVFCELYGPAERDRQGFPISSYSFVSVSLLFSWTMGEEEKREEILDVISEEAGALATAEGTKSLNSSVI
ncbi:hypothetical protein F2Q70_00035421 [Brassica cretica]|uniref:Uncharacterized protein n=1 Tax=Brassica cretica TaxID=69181 RepID=A0A8S9JYS5_BRACR|nr:hypothetical protein F2Q68_00030577 [Brassica cretica]KAF2586738.1 hypothetical protein F2Q70_00035421 [Brassica cretica]